MNHGCEYLRACVSICGPVVDADSLRDIVGVRMCCGLFYLREHVLCLDIFLICFRYYVRIIIFRYFGDARTVISCVCGEKVSDVL